VKSGDQSVECRSSETGGIVTADVMAESRLCTLPVTTVADESGISCRIKLADASVSAVEESLCQGGESLKRLLPDEAAVNDDTKRRRVDSVDHSTDTADTASEPVDGTPDANTVVNFISSSGEHSSQGCSLPNDKAYTVTAGQLQTTLSPSLQNSSKSKISKPVRTKSTKTNRRLKPVRSRRTVKTVASAEPPVFEKSINSAAEAETLPAESESKLDRSTEKCSPPLMDGNHETTSTDTTAVVKYSVANSVDKMCDVSTDVSSAPSNSEQKTLRISLIALNESSAAAHRAKDSKTECVYNTDKMTSSSAAVAVYTATTASVVNNLKQLMSVCSPADAEIPAASAGSIFSQESVALERDSSTLLSQCKSLSVVLEKMHNNRSTPPPTSVASSTGRRRKGGLAHRRFGSAAKADVPVSDSPLMAETPAVVPLPASSVEDEYRFSDDAVSDSLASQRRAHRLERKTSSRKTRNSLPAVDQIKASLTATSDSTSHNAVNTMDSSVSSENTGIGSLTPNVIQKVTVTGRSAETGSGRSRRRRHSLQDDEDTRSLSPITQNGSSPTAFVEASLDGHKLKLRITKCANRSVEATPCDAALPVPPSSSVEFTESKTELTVDKVPAPPPDLEAPPSVEVIRERVSRRRRQLKVEGVRSRFLTLHKPSSVVPLADHVKCRLVKVGRRQWMSVGGEEPDDDLSSSQHSDTETSVRNSPAASVDEMAQHPTRDRLLLAGESKKQHRRGRPPKAKTVSADTDSSAVTAKRNKKRLKTDTGRLEVSFSKPEPPPPEVVTRPVRVDAVPWLDSETDGSETQPYCALVDSSSRTIATDIDEYRFCMSAPAEFTSNIDRVISNALSDCGIECTYNTVLTPKSMFFVPSELERLMEALVLDDLRRQPRTPPTIAVPETDLLSSVTIGRTFSYSNSVSSPVFSPQNDVEVDVFLSQPSLRLQSCTSLPVDANDGSDYDCAVFGYEYPSSCYPDSVGLPPLLDAQFIDEDCLLPSACVTDQQLYSCVDLVL